MNKILPYIFQNNFKFFFNAVASLENEILNIKNIQIQKPIFVSGLARSGTTAVAYLLDNFEQTGSFQYRDLPFYKIPFFWNKINYYYYLKVTQNERLHKDGIFVGPNSPDSFEELIWKEHIEKYDNFGFSKVLDKEYLNERLSKNLLDSFKKILAIRNGTRYFSKGNYNFLRFKYLLNIFPDAKIIICIRDPIATAMSLERIHNQFMKYQNSNSQFEKELNILGHYEFGSNRKALNLNEINYNKTLKLWGESNSFMGYLYQWLDIYNFIRKQYLENNEVSGNFIVLDNSDLMYSFSKVLNKVRDFCNLENYNENNFNTNINYNSRKYSIESNSYNKDIIMKALNLYSYYKNNFL